jgi:hypothetical protein
MKLHLKSLLEQGYRMFFRVAVIVLVALCEFGWKWFKVDSFPATILKALQLRLHVLIWKLSSPSTDTTSKDLILNFFKAESRIRKVYFWSSNTAATSCNWRRSNEDFRSIS